jgi:hypothetical protein
MLTREGTNAIGFRIRGNDQILPKDIEHFRAFRELLGSKFTRGYVLYLGKDIRKLDDDVYALPLNYLWSDYEQRLGDLEDDSTPAAPEDGEGA